ncbi:hypothetical protein B0H14DRAFT_3420707 [Mycena olivaceomarginata]|nr:hypothetical protein B0H14DRAFT_3420707 [Mycena olivaceomarginata]
MALCEPSARVTDELGRTRRIFHNGILRYRKQLPSETNALPISQMPSSLSNSLSHHHQQDTTIPQLYSHLLPTTQGRRHGRRASPIIVDTIRPVPTCGKARGRPLLLPFPYDLSRQADLARA